MKPDNELPDDALRPKEASHQASPELKLGWIFLFIIILSVSGFAIWEVAKQF